MFNQVIQGFHLVRFGTAADQKFLLGRFLPTYDQLIINANIVAHMPSALSSFLSVKAKNKPYFIDPQTHAFQHDRKCIESEKTGEIKKSIQKLLDAFGEPVNSCINVKRRSVQPSDFSNKKILTEFCERVLKFQCESLYGEIHKSDSAKYYKFVEEEEGGTFENLFKPTLVVAPYFFLEIPSMNKWLDVNLQCVERSVGIAKALGLPLGVQVVISRDVLMQDRKIKAIIEQYKKTKADVFLVWVDAFSEQEASKEELVAFSYFMKSLGEKIPLINLYGGFFSIALAKSKVASNLIGVSHGLEYGESRGVIPVGGGLPTAKFYFPSLHTRLLFRDAIRALKATEGVKSASKFHEVICNCSMCKKVIKNNPETDFGVYGRTKDVTFNINGQKVTRSYPLPETKDKTVEHYMWCKKNEYKTQLSKEELVKNLKGASKNLGKALKRHNIGHCDVWARVLESQ